MEPMLGTEPWGENPVQMLKALSAVGTDLARGAVQTAQTARQK